MIKKLNHTINKLPNGDFEVMPIFTEHDNMTISKEAFDLAKHMAVEQYKSDVLLIINNRMEQIQKQLDRDLEAANQGRLAGRVMELRDLKFIIEQS